MALPPNRPKYTPTMVLGQIKDEYTQRNFQAIQQFFEQEGQLNGFRFIEFSVDAASEDFRFSHNLGFVPRDVVITRVTGSGTVTLNYDKFNNNTISLTTTGACHVRGFIGTYSKDLSADTLESAPQPQTFATAAEASSSTSAASTSGFSAGMTILWSGPKSTIPSGWLMCDSTAYATTAYPALFAAIGYSWGGSSGTFRVPETRGLFIRGVSDGLVTYDPDKATRTAIAAGGNTGDAVGSYQDHGFQDHVHQFTTNHAPALNFSIGSRPPRTQDTGGVSITTGGVTGGYNAISETRPRNVGMYYIIKT